MALIKYLDKKIQQAGLDQISKVNDIIEEYQDQGYTLTLRQLFYQLVSRDLAENTVLSYKNLGNLVTNGRMCGLIDWDAIEDRTREARDTYGILRWHDHVVKLGDIKWAIRRQIEGFGVDAWLGQPYYIEVWVEKSALENVVERAAKNCHYAPYLATRGYPSITLLKDAADRFIEHSNDGQQCVILHLGDHDPSGVDMTRDLQDRLAKLKATKGVVEVRRIALNMNQVEQYDPPPNPAKETDTRAEEYIRKFGSVSWELDALRPEILCDLIEAEIGEYFDEAIYTENQKRRKEAIEAMWEKYRPLLAEIDKMNEEETA